MKVVLDTQKLDALIRATDKSPDSRYVADAVHYGIYQELGTSRNAAHPFMIPAVEVVRRGFLLALRSPAAWMRLEDVVEKAARDVEGHAKMRAPVDTGALKNSIHVTKDKPA
jgi:hypothetical protein